MTGREEVAPSVVALLHEAATRGELKSERVVAGLEQQILSGRLPAGTRLPTEEELCEILGVSRSVVRDAMRTLVARGLVTVRQGRGTSVAAPSDVAYSGALLALLARSELTMGDVVAARATIETQLAGVAAVACTDADLALLEDCLDRFAAAVAADETGIATNEHLRFHKTILEAVHQPALNLILRPMTEIILVSSTASLRPRTPADWEVETHRPVLRALQARDPDAAVVAMAAHFTASTRPKPYRKFLARPFSEAYFDLVR
jgi:DNA-binding FadR family transcriptional regulator